MTLGAVCTSLLGLILPDDDDDLELDVSLYMLLAVPVLPCLLRMILITFYFTYETPKYYILNKKKRKSREVLKLLYKEEYINSQLLQIYNDTKGPTGQDLTIIDQFTFLRKPLLISLALGFFLQMTGVNVMIFYSYDVFGHSHNS